MRKEQTMDEQKQIEELSEFFYHVDGATYRGGPIRVVNYDALALALYDAGYRKQVEGEWIWKKKIEAQAQNRLYCSVCDDECLSKNNYYVKSNYCPNCGAKMKGV